MIQRQSTSRINLYQCEPHKKAFTSICTSPVCGKYRELCLDCVELDKEHLHDHKDKEEAFQQVKNDIDTVFKGLKALRKKILYTMDTRAKSQIGLKQIEEKLEEIKKNLNSKIDNFHSELKRIYHKNIREKLNQLFFIVEKSYEFLEQQKTFLFKTKRLKPFFLNDIKHDLRHYESYYQEVLQKNVRKFKAGLEHDKVIELMVSFEQNLAQIFVFDVPFSIQYEPHLIIANPKNYTLHKFQNGELSTQQVEQFGRNSAESGETDILPSVYFSPTESYYIFGEQNKESNRIRRLQLNTKQFKNMEIKLETKRVNFSICLFRKQIFIVGGQNYKEGCLIKCEKFVPLQGKTYIVNSLNQRSSQHTLCNYKDKFILKIGGTDVVRKEIKRDHQILVNRIVNPEIYFGENEDWKVVELSFSNPKKGVNFGLWPTVLVTEGSQQIIILEGLKYKKSGYKERYDMTLQVLGRQLKEVKVYKKETDLSIRLKIFTEMSFYNERNKSFMLTCMNVGKENLMLRQFFIGP